MSKFVQGIQSLFSGTDNSAQQAEIARQREQQNITLTRQQQELQATEAEQNKQSGTAARQPRGRRLLLAATGEAGVQSTLG